MDDIGSIIGILSGLISIFTFATGINSIAHIWGLKKAGTASAINESRIAARRLLLVIPLFIVSISVTALMGLSGSDSGGIISLLLIIGLLSVLSFHWFGISRALPVTVYGIISGVVIGGLGLLFGVISRGEQGFGLAAGIAIGVGSWAITALIQHQQGAPTDLDQSPSREENLDATAQADYERTILQIASQQHGQVRVTDIALKSDLSLDEAARALDALMKRDYCRAETLESGAIVYRFPDLEAT